MGIIVNFTFSRYFKISNSSESQNAQDLVHVKAHVFREKTISIIPVENQASDTRRMRVNPSRSRGRHQLTFPTFEKPTDHPTFHLNLKTFEND